jgi:hypothetical protein
LDLVATLKKASNIALCILLIMLIWLCVSALARVTIGKRTVTYTRLPLANFELVSSIPQKGTYVESYGVDVKFAESAYWNVRSFLGADSIVTPVKIYVAKPRIYTGIGYLHGVLVNGLYLNDTLVYNGDLFILIHELAHHFYAHMQPHLQKETYAKLVEMYFRLAETNKNLNKQIYELQELLKDRVKQNAYRS